MTLLERFSPVVGDSIHQPLGVGTAAALGVGTGLVLFISYRSKIKTSEARKLRKDGKKPQRISLFLFDFSSALEGHWLLSYPIIGKVFSACISSYCRLVLWSSILGIKDVSIVLNQKSNMYYAVSRIDADERVDSIYKGQVQTKSQDIQIAATKLFNASVTRLKHACVQGIVPKELLMSSFEGVKKHYKSQQLMEYSRYKNWTRSCYMESHPFLPPQAKVTKPLYDSLKEILDIGKSHFAAWYKELNNLDEVEVITLNSFVTKYLPNPGENEFGKHVDGAKIDGSLILALPTDDPHDWPGLLVW